MKNRMARPVIRSDGCEFASVSDAASSCATDPQRVIAAAKATEIGVHKTLSGFQWAYADQKPITWPKRESYQGRSASVVRSDGRQFNSLLEAGESVNYTTSAISQAARATSRREFMEVGGYQWAYSSFVPEVWPKKPE